MQMCSNPSIINSMQHLQSPAMNPIPPCTYVKVLYGQAIALPPHHQNQILPTQLRTAHGLAYRHLTDGRRTDYGLHTDLQRAIHGHTTDKLRSWFGRATDFTRA